MRDLATARAERDAAVARVSANANAHAEDWTDEAEAALRRFVLAKSIGDRFTADDARESAEVLSVAEPHDKRAWGAVFKALARAGMIERVGFAPSRYRHAAPTVEWQRVK